MTEAILAVRNVEVIYDRVFLAVKGVSLEVPAGGMVALLGANGAGKSTMLKAISGLLGPERGDVTRGEIRLAGRDVLRLGPSERVRLGLVHVLEGRRVFEHLTPDEEFGVVVEGAGYHLITLGFVSRVEQPSAQALRNQLVPFPRDDENRSIYGCDALDRRIAVE